MPYKAVVFDLFGTMSHASEALKNLGSFLGTAEKERAMYWMGAVLKTEIGETSLEEFEEEFIEEVSKMEGHLELDKYRHSLDVKYNGTRELMDKALLAANLKIRENGYKTAVLTNNFYADKNKTLSIAPVDPTCFDFVQESCREGVSKPDKKAFDLVLGKLGCEAKEVIFLDDTARFTTAADELGFTTILVKNQEEAAEQLLKLLNLN